MARPDKQHYDYLPLDADTQNDYRIKYLETEYGKFHGEIYFIRFLQFLCRNNWAVYDTREVFKGIELATVLDMNEEQISLFLGKLEKIGVIITQLPYIYSDGLIRRLKDATTKRKEYKEFLAGQDKNNEKLKIVHRILNTKSSSLFSDTELKKNHQEMLIEADTNHLFTNPKVLEAHIGYKEMRKKKGAIYTEHAERLIVSKLNQLVTGKSEKDMIILSVEMLNQSARNGWTDIYLPTQQNGNSKNVAAKGDKGGTRKNF